jgi:putative oxidoreductase
MAFDWLNRYSPQALGALRIVTGLLFGEHGTQKLLNFPANPMMAGGGGGGPPPGSDGGGMGSMGTIMLVAGILETFGGLAIVLGFLTRPIAFILCGMSAVIFWWMHVSMMGQGAIFPILNGGESAVLFCFVFLYLVFAGAGAFSVDGALAKRKA